MRGRSKQGKKDMKQEILKSADLIKRDAQERGLGRLKKQGKGYNTSTDIYKRRIGRYE